MPEGARVTDMVSGQCAHGCPACPHPVTGMIVKGSTDVFINGLPAARKDDPGVHIACCAANQFTISAGSSTVFINGIAAARKGDSTKHCGGQGNIKAGSSNVIIN